MKPKPPVPFWRWLTWCGILAAALFVFYVLFTPFWMATRALAWAADFRARRRPGYLPPVRTEEAADGPPMQPPSDVSLR